jgi:peptidoglycan/xylan/chitin deacetylase (PgdA/CDA1 family)
MSAANEREARRSFIKRAGVLLGTLASADDCPTSAAESRTERLVVLTFDDAVKNHRTLVAPLLRELGFGATFFVTHRWMVDDPQHYLTWREIAEIHQLGFEIGNHSWTHPNFAVPRDAARLPAELALVEQELRQVGVPRPISFAWCGNGFGPEAIQQLEGLGYQLARRGMQPEVPYGQREIGPTFNPRRHHRLLIPSTGDAYPNWTLPHFRSVVDRAAEGEVVVLQFHGVPDPHSWVNTSPERFREYMSYLKRRGFKVIPLRDVRKYLPVGERADDPLLKVRYPELRSDQRLLPVEMKATQGELPFWLEDMVRYHRYSWREVAQVTGIDVETLKRRAQELHPLPAAPAERSKLVRVLPYPGGRHPRKGFREGAILPQRGTKFSAFAPWDESSYAVVDLPEAIFSNLGLTYLAHTHIPTIWDERNIWLDNVDWERRKDGNLSRRQRLPNGISFGASVRPSATKVDLELWLQNGSPAKLTGLRTQICVMLAGMSGFEKQTNDNKRFHSPVAAAQSTARNRWVLTAWDRCGRAWGNTDVPCLHADPVLPDCRPGETVHLHGRLWFYEGSGIEHELEEGRRGFAALAKEK